MLYTKVNYLAKKFYISDPKIMKKFPGLEQGPQGLELGRQGN
jgi:hypothetical protein